MAIVEISRTVMFSYPLPMRSSTSTDEVVYQRRFAATDVDDGGGGFRGGSPYQFKRQFEMWTIPADSVRGLSAVDFFPMRLGVHTAPSFDLHLLASRAESGYLNSVGVNRRLHKLAPFVRQNRAQ